MSQRYRERWNRTRAKGKQRYILFTVLRLGLGFATILACVSALMNGGFSFQGFISAWPLRLWIICLILGSFAGLIFASLEWNYYERKYPSSMESPDQRENKII
jgi:hypothetical protein